MTIEETIEQYPDVVKADGFDEAILGVGLKCNTPALVYDKNKVLEILMERDKMSAEEAEEFFEFNIQCAYVGEHTPIFLETFDKEGL